MVSECRRVSHDSHEATCHIEKKLAWPTNTQPTINAAPAAKYSTGSAGYRPVVRKQRPPVRETGPRLPAHPAEAAIRLGISPAASCLAVHQLPVLRCPYVPSENIERLVSDTIPEDRIPWLRQELLTWLIRLCDGPTFVTTKLCLALTAYALHAVPTKWPHFITDFCHILQSGAQAQGKNPRNVKGTLLEFLTVVPEEVSTADLIGDRKAKINQELLDAVPLVITTLQTFLAEPLPPGNADVVVKQKALRCFQSWVQYGIPLLYVSLPFINYCFYFVSTDIGSHTDTPPFLSPEQNILPPRAAHNVAPPPLNVSEIHSRSENDDQSARTLCRIMTSFGESYTDFIARHLLRGDVISYLDMMIGFAGFPGHFGADQEISEIPLNFWYDLQESLVDAEVLGGGGGNGDDEELVDPEETAKRIVREEEARRAREAAYLVYRKLVGVLRMKVEYPLDEEWAGWTKGGLWFWF
ncbi:hypothetical protein BC936DRAFT_138565, partial [Jimgerdemannia flammicorona]